MKSGFIKKIEDINLFQISFISYKKKLLWYSHKNQNLSIKYQYVNLIVNTPIKNWISSLNIENDMVKCLKSCWI